MEGDAVSEDRWPKQLLIPYGSRYGPSGVYTRVEPAVLVKWHNNLCVPYECDCRGKSIYFQDAKPTLMTVTRALGITPRGTVY